MGMDEIKVQIPGQFYDKSGEENSIFENQLLTYEQAARVLSVSESYLRRLKARREIPSVLVGNRAVRFRVCSLNRWIEKRELK
jgi:excisionase family DNA binding protein